jgi:hypothetical protein
VRNAFIVAVIAKGRGEVIAAFARNVMWERPSHPLKKDIIFNDYSEALAEREGLSFSNENNELEGKPVSEPRIENIELFYEVANRSDRRSLRACARRQQGSIPTVSAISKPTHKPRRRCERHSIALHLHALAARLRRLSPCRRDPEHFHLEKNEIESELLRLADSLSSAVGCHD